MIKKKTKSGILVVAIVLMLSLLTGCVGEEKWEFHQDMILMEGETQNISGTNYSIKLLDAKHGYWNDDNRVTIEVRIANSTVKRKILSRADGEEEWSYKGIKIELVATTPAFAELKIYLDKGDVDNG